MRRYVPPLSFGVVLAVLSAATVVGVGVSIVTHRVFLIPFVIGAAIAVGVAYILLFGAPLLEEEPSTILAEPAEPAGELSPPSAADTVPSPPRPNLPVLADPVDLDPSYDPVEDADRIESERRPE
jgi:hypothetical protein